MDFKVQEVSHNEPPFITYRVVNKYGTTVQEVRYSGKSLVTKDGYAADSDVVKAVESYLSTH